jgi:hypothetical protein
MSIPLVKRSFYTDKFKKQLVVIAKQLIAELQLAIPSLSLSLFPSIQRTGCYKMPCRTIAKLMKYSVSIGLLHLGMNVITRVSQFRNFLGQQLNTIYRVTKNDALVDFKLGEECIQTVDLLPFLHIGIELCNTTKGEFIHEVNAIGFINKLLTKGFNRNGKGGAKETDLVTRVTKPNDLFEYGLKFG